MTPQTKRPAAPSAGHDTPRHPRHARGALLAAALVLLAHGWLLAGLPGSHSAGARRPASALPRPLPVRVRQIPAEAAMPPAWPAPAPAAATGPQGVPAAQASVPVPARRPAGVPLAARGAAPAAAENPVQPAQDRSAAEPLPVYATRLPPTATLHYALQRGQVAGVAALHWRAGPDGYRLSLQHGGAAGVRLDWASEGDFDAAGVAPSRYTESRRGRELRAANFQREAGLITFSGPAVQHPLWRGAQDRLSWMIQLGAVLAAAPERALPGEQVSMWVVGSRGDAEPWVFTVIGHEDLALPAGPVAGAVLLLREPRRPYDTRAEVWLDPARHHLPVRLRLRVPASGDALELQLQGPPTP